MASAEWLEIFRTYSPDQLAAHIHDLKRQVSVFSSQQIGSKSYTKDLRELREQFASAVRVQTERGLPPGDNPFVGLTDFSRIRY